MKVFTDMCRYLLIQLCRLQMMEGDDVSCFFDGDVWDCDSSSSEESTVATLPLPPPPQLQLCDCGVLMDSAEIPQHMLSDWHLFNLKRKTASPRLRRKPISLEAFERWAAHPRRWQSKTGHIRCRAAAPADSTTAAAAPSTTAAAVPVPVHRQLSWTSSIDVLEEVLRVVELDPLCQASAVCTSWRAVISRVREERWSVLREAREQRAPAKPHGRPSALDEELREEVARLVRSFGTVAKGTTIDTQPRRDPPPISTAAEPPYDFGRDAMELLRRGAGTHAIVPHAHYAPGGHAGVPWFDPDSAPLNTAALFVGVAARLEARGRDGMPESVLEAQRAEAATLFAALATAPGTALRDDVFSVCVRYYHECAPV